MSDQELEIKDLPVTCDLCAHPGVPDWRYDLPPNTTILAAVDLETKTLHKTVAHAGMAACEACDSLIQRDLRETLAGPTAPVLIARRMTRLEPFKGMTHAQVRRSRIAWARRLRVLIPLLTNRRQYVPGEDPMDHTGLFFRETY